MSRQCDDQRIGMRKKSHSEWPIQMCANDPLGPRFLCQVERLFGDSHERTGRVSPARARRRRTTLTEIFCDSMLIGVAGVAGAIWHCIFAVWS
jgi:hypothetical protein